MKTSYQHLKSKPSVFKNFTGLTLEGFAELLPAFEAADRIALDEQRSSPRQRQAGGGRRGALPSAADKLVFILVYFRFYPVQILQGYLFGLSQPQANAWIHRLTPVLNAALGYEKQLPARQSKDLAAILSACPGLEFIIDGTERPIRRPIDPQRQENHYSGKKKRHTVKNNVITDKRTKKIKGLSPTVEGKRHDKKLADEQDLVFPPGSTLWKDTGFQGYEPDGIQTRQPQKKPKGGQLTPDEKANNSDISRERIGVEHAIGGVKVFAIARDIFRNLKVGFDDLVMETACGLHNLRIDHPLSA